MGGALSSPFCKVSHKPLTSQRCCWQHNLAWDSEGVEAAVDCASDRLITRCTCSVRPTDTDRRCSRHTERSQDESRMARYQVQFARGIINPSDGESETRGWQHGRKSVLRQLVARSEVGEITSLDCIYMRDLGELRDNLYICKKLTSLKFIVRTM